MRVALALFLSTLLAATTATAQESSASPSYRIGPGDTLGVSIVELPELNGEYEVGGDGSIDLPVVGSFQTLGLTESELAQSLERRLEARFVQRATVSARVLAYRTLPVLVLGAVGSEGNLSPDRNARLLDVLLEAGGLGSGHGGVVRVSRQASNGLSDQVEISVEALIDRADPAVNLPIFPGDRITVPRAEEVTIYFVGEGAPGGSVKFKSNERVTLLKAIVRAGGLGENAAKKVTIKRFDERGELEEIKAHFQRILDGKDPDVALEDGDIVVVKESFF